MDPKLPTLPDGYDWHVEIGNIDHLNDAKNYIESPEPIIIELQAWDEDTCVVVKEIHVDPQAPHNTAAMIERAANDVASKIVLFEKVQSKVSEIDKWVERHTLL